MSENTKLGVAYAKAILALFEKNADMAYPEAEVLCQVIKDFEHRFFPKATRIKLDMLNELLAKGHLPPSEGSYTQSNVQRMKKELREFIQKNEAAGVDGSEILIGLMSVHDIMKVKDPVQRKQLLDRQQKSWGSMLMGEVPSFYGKK